MEFMAPSRYAYLHPANESEEDESVLLRKTKTCHELSVADFQSLRHWLQNELGADYVLVRGRGWMSLRSMERQMPLPEEFVVHARESAHGKRTRATTLDDPTTGISSTKRIKAIEEYKPYYMEPDKILGASERFLLPELRWLYLLAEEGKKVRLEKLRKLRSDRVKPKEGEYYAGVLALLQSASLGQQGLSFSGQGYGNVVRSDLQGWIGGERRAACEVKADLKKATDKDRHGIESNAVAIKQVADFLAGGIERTEDSVRLGCLFSRMDRFFVVKFQRGRHTVAITPSFPPAQSLNVSPGPLGSAEEERFIIMRLRWLDKFCGDKVALSDILPAEPTAGFRSLVAYVEELQRIFKLAPSTVRFVRRPGVEIPVAEMSCLAFGPKSAVLLRRSSMTVVKVCLPEHAMNEVRVHSVVDGQENVRRLVSHGNVDVGKMKGVFHFLELEGYGEPLGSSHLHTMEATERMWSQAMSALEHLHAKEVLHRDVKPDNMLVFDGLLKLNDFDVSCFRGDARGERQVVGTEGFQSPSGSSPYSEQDDILSLGLAFFKLRAGVCVPGKNERLRILRHQLHPDIFPARMRRDVSLALQSLGLA